MTADERMVRDVKSYYHNNIKGKARNQRGVVEDFSEHVTILERFNSGSLYYSEKDEFFVGEWSIQTPELYHRHKELGIYVTADGMFFQGYADPKRKDSYTDHYNTHIMWDAANGECGLCSERIPGEIMMMHNFYKLP